MKADSTKEGQDTEVMKLQQQDRGQLATSCFLTNSRDYQCTTFDIRGLQKDDANEEGDDAAKKITMHAGIDVDSNDDDDDGGDADGDDERYP